MTRAVEREAALPRLLPTQRLGGFPQFRASPALCWLFRHFFFPEGSDSGPAATPACLRARLCRRNESRSLLTTVSAVGPRPTSGEPAQLARRKRPGQERGPGASPSPHRPLQISKGVSSSPGPTGLSGINELYVTNHWSVGKRLSEELLNTGDRLYICFICLIPDDKNFNVKNETIKILQENRGDYNLELRKAFSKYEAITRNHKKNQ